MLLAVFILIVELFDSFAGGLGNNLTQGKRCVSFEVEKVYHDIMKINI